MKKEWNDPKLVELSVQHTEQSPSWLTNKDGEFVDANGNYSESRS